MIGVYKLTFNVGTSFHTYNVRSQLESKQLTQHSPERMKSRRLANASN